MKLASELTAPRLQSEARSRPAPVHLSVPAMAAEATEPRDWAGQWGQGWAHGWCRGSRPTIWVESLKRGQGGSQTVSYIPSPVGRPWFSFSVTGTSGSPRPSPSCSKDDGRSPPGLTRGGGSESHFRLPSRPCSAPSLVGCVPLCLFTASVPCFSLHSSIAGLSHRSGTG